ncbi:MAG: hypothetical protein HUJ66_00125, partial [Oscillospiraceae bacterium]|nr:hypothetical protein [Oscillospiraceae bacterium]
MKKSVKRTLAAALALLMLISVFGVSALAERNERLPQYKNYTILGDSNSSGYGLDAYVENADGAFVKEGALIEGSYPAILADALGCENVFVHSHSGWRTNELLYMMDPDTEVSYSDFFLRALGFVPADTLIGKSEAIIANVSASDLITIEYGANDIYSYSVYKLIVEHGEELSYLLSGLGETPADISELLEDILAAADKAGVLAEVISDFMSYLTETTASYKENMVAIIERIRELNPNAKLVVLGLISPVSFDIRGENGSVILDINTGIDRRMKEVN